MTISRSFGEFKWCPTNYQRTADSTEYHLINWCAILNWYSIAICKFYDGIGGFITLWMIITNNNAIRILQSIRKLPDFSVHTFQFNVSKVTISVVRMFVFVVFLQFLLQRIFLIFMRPKKVTFVKNSPFEFIFQINNWIFNSSNTFFAYWYISCLWCSWYINA